jgi:hypothetical protein
MTSEDLYPPRLSTVLALAWKRLTLHASAHHGASPAPQVLALAWKRSRRKPRAPSDVGLGLLALVC